MSGIAFYFLGFPVCTFHLLRHKIAQKGGGMDRNRTFFPFGGAAGCNLYHPLSAVCRPLSAARPSDSTLGTGISGCPAGGPHPPGNRLPPPLLGECRAGGGGRTLLSLSGLEKSALRPCGGAAGRRAGECCLAPHPSGGSAPLSRPGERYPSHRRYTTLKKAGPFPWKWSRWFYSLFCVCPYALARSTSSSKLGRGLSVRKKLKVPTATSAPSSLVSSAR